MFDYPRDRLSLERDCEMDFFVAGGPGGQHRNRTESGVRLTHRPTGLVVTATERRSQSVNRETAFARMARTLVRFSIRPKIRRPTRPSAESVRRRLDRKKMRGGVKSSRSKISDVD